MQYNINSNINNNDNNNNISNTNTSYNIQGYLNLPYGISEVIVMCRPSRQLSTYRVIFHSAIAECAMRVLFYINLPEVRNIGITQCLNAKVGSVEMEISNNSLV